MVESCRADVSWLADDGTAGVLWRLPVEERSESFLGSQVGVVRGSGDVAGVVRDVVGRVSGGHLRKRDHFQDVGEPWVGFWYLFAGEACVPRRTRAQNSVRSHETLHVVGRHG